MVKNFPILIALGVLLLLTTGCGEQNTQQPQLPTTAAQALIATPPPIPPTNTPQLSNVTAEPGLDQPAPESEAAAEPSVTPDLSQTVISFRYQIPALGLDRRFEGTIASNIELTDVTMGRTERLRNRGGILLEVQSVLENVVLAELPEGCDTCVQFTYDMPLAGESGSGWLQDAILLASIDNFLSVWLGAYFPPETAVGLHRNASGYEVAHTIAILGNGQVWRWQAIDNQVSLPQAEVELSNLIQQANNLPLSRLESSYTAECDNFTREELFIDTAVQSARIEIRCPNLSLPVPLTPFYQSMATLAAEGLDPTLNLERPDQLLDLNTIIYYRRQDGATLEVRLDGSYTAVDSAGAAVVGSLEPSRAISLTNAMIQSDVMPRGVSIVNETAVEELDVEDLLLVRGELGVYEFGWSDGIGTALIEGVSEIQELLVSEVGFLSATSTPLLLTPTLALTPTITATVTLTPTTTP